MIKEEYSSYKLIHHSKAIDDLKNGKQIVPIQVQFVPSNVCNQRCSFCAYRSSGYRSNQTFNDKEIISFEKAIETIECFADMGVKAVQFTGGGEPLVHPKIYEIISTAMVAGLDVALVTNGQALNDDICELLGLSSWVRVSVDSATKETYSLLRGTSESVFDRVVKNISSLVKHKKSNTIGIGFVVTKENYREVYDAARMFKDLGVDNIRISASFNNEGVKYFDSFLNTAKSLSSECERLSDDKFTVFNMFNDRIGDLFDGSQNYPYCAAKELFTYVGADYNVYTCCTLAYNKSGLIGSIKDRSFKDLWNSSEKTKMFSEHDPSKMCRHPCMYTGKNAFASYCINKNPRHVNFV